MAITPDAFNIDSKFTKDVTNREGAGLSIGSASQSYTPASPPSFEVTVQEGPTVSEVTKTYTGPNSGVGKGAGEASHPTDSFGWTSPTGNKIAINGTAGSETIELVHHSGAAIMIDADGAIFVMPTGRKGFGLNASKGDGVIAAQNRVVIKGTGGIVVETEGSMEFNIGKNLLMDVGGDFNLTVGGATGIQSDGTLTVEAVKDVIETIGGVRRTTIAGDMRTQVVGEIRYDAGKNIETRTNQDYIAYAQKSIFLAAKESSNFEVDTGKLNLISKDDITVASDTAAYIQSENDITLESAQNLSIRSGGNFVASSKGNIYNDTEGSYEIRSTSSTQDVSGPYLMRSTSATFSTTGTLDILATGATKLHAAGTLDVKGSTIGLNNPGSATAPTAPLAQETTSPRKAAKAFSPLEAEFPDANSILDNITSEREAPDFPENAKKLSEDAMSLYENEGDTPNPKAKARAAGNRGAGSPYNAGGGLGIIGDSGNYSYDGSNNKSTGQESSYPLPGSLLNSNEKLSRHVTVGMFGNLSKCPSTNNGLSRGEILKNAQHLCVNILDPLIDKFGSKIRMNPNGAGLRIGNGGSKHYSGKAHDIRSATNDHAETAMIAKYIVENLPFDRCFLEANASGTIHIHVEAAPPGSQGQRTVWTCSDPKCNSRTEGLQLAYAQQGLKRMGFA